MTKTTTEAKTALDAARKRLAGAKDALSEAYREVSVASLAVDAAAEDYAAAVQREDDEIRALDGSVRHCPDCGAQLVPEERCGCCATARAYDNETPLGLELDGYNDEF